MIFHIDNTEPEPTQNISSSMGDEICSTQPGGVRHNLLDRIQLTLDFHSPGLEWLR